MTSMDARSSYREAVTRGARPVQLVIALYEQSIADLRGAIVALEKNDIEERTRAINHAIMVIGHLESSLDKKQGGAVAVQLERFYNQVRTSLIEAHFQQSVAALERQISHLMLVREAWDEVERISRSGSAGFGESSQTTGEGQLRPVRDWNG